jgi:sporulation protein YlmC with PRC-barrel domain
MRTAKETRQDELARDEVGSLISAEKVRGTNLYNRAGDDLGAVENVMIDKPSGKVAYAVIAFGGFLGMGQERRALPWSVLHYDTKLGGYVSNAADDVLKNAPVFEENDYGDRVRGTRLHEHFGVPPYWL